jgi:hypothetical protein
MIHMPKASKPMEKERGLGPIRTLLTKRLNREKKMRRAWRFCFFMLGGRYRWRRKEGRLNAL